MSQYTGRKKEIVLIGDSLTEFFDWQGRFPSHRVLNLGIAGEPVEGLLGRMSDIRTAIVRADLVFVMTGINNIAMEDYDIIPRYEKVLDTLVSDSAGAEIVIQSILPVRLPWVDNAEIEKINSDLEKTARGMKVRYFDIYHLFVDAGGNPVREYLSEDGVHLSARGYEVWSGAIEKEFSL
ncbi:MAG: GDSL-type esterase/lipase family protein [Candidatus Sulfobium sp.]|jgi:lysophospholipase L1-like esterase